jgi:hypothetical protein
MAIWKEREREREREREDRSLFERKKIVVWDVALRSSRGWNWCVSRSFGERGRIFKWEANVTCEA